jgi:pyruvate ferredoxin oxidoreductase alpha subunit
LDSDPTAPVVVAMGSVLGTLRAAAADLRAEGLPLGLISLSSYRPFPAAALRAAVGRAEPVIVLDRAVAPGLGGILAGDVSRVLDSAPTRVRGLIAGLGGRGVTAAALRSAILEAVAGRLEPLTWLDLDRQALGRTGEL